MEGRTSVTLDELAAFSQGMAASAADPWEGGDRIISAFYSRFKI